MLESLWAKYVGSGYDTSLKSRNGNIWLFPNKNSIIDRVAKWYPLFAITILDSGCSYVLYKHSQEIIGAWKVTFEDEDVIPSHLVGSIYFSCITVRKEKNMLIYLKDRGDIGKNVARCYLILPLQEMVGSQTAVENPSHLTWAASDRLCSFPIDKYDGPNTFLATFANIGHMEYGCGEWERLWLWDDMIDKHPYATRVNT